MKRGKEKVSTSVSKGVTERRVLEEVQGGILPPVKDDSLTTAQLSLEEESYRTGIATYRNRVQRLREKELSALEKPVIHLLKVYLDPLSTGLAQWVNEMMNRPGRRASAVPLLANIDPDVAALITLRTVLNRLSVNPTYQNVALLVGRAIEDELRFAAFEEQKPGLYKKVQSHIDEHPQGYDPHYRRRVLVHATSKYRVVWEPWSNEQRLHVGSAMLDLMIEKTGLVQVTLVRSSNRTGDRLRVVPTDELMRWVDEQHARCELLNPRHIPMLVPPRPFTTATDGGYLTKGLRYPLVHRKHASDTAIPVTAEQMPAVFNAVNALQAVPFRIKTKVFEVLDHLWEIGADIPAGGQDFISRMDRPLPPKPHDIETNADARRRYKTEARDIYVGNLSNRGRRLAVSTTLSIARRFIGQDIYFPVKLDFRGRMYAVPQFLSPQGPDFARGMLEFARGEKLGRSGLKWLKIHTANTFGVDKVSMEERIAWVDENIDRIKRAAADPLAETWWHEADAPIQFLSACLDLAAAVSSPDPTQYVSHLIIMVDGSCNGIQHLAALMLDEEAGAYVNLVPGDKPQDIYGRVASETLKSLEAICSSPVSSESASSASSSSTPSLSDTHLARLWIEYGVDRSLCKRPTMILPYGGTRQAVEQYIDESVSERVKNGKPHPFGIYRRRAVNFLAGVVWESMNRVVSGPRALMDWTREVARQVSKAGHPLRWRTPSGFVVRQARLQVSGRRVQTRLGDRVVKLTLVHQTEKIDSRKQAQALAPNWIHSLDAAALHLTINRLVERGVVDIAAIHDSYGTHAGSMDLLAGTLREVFVEMYREDQIARFVEDVSSAVGVEELPAPPPKGRLDVEQVSYSRYFFA